MHVYIKDTSIPVLVLNVASHGSPGMLRSLGRLGVSMYVVYTEPHGPAIFSKYCRRKFYWDFDSASPEASINFLLYVSSEIGRRSILLPTCDHTAALVAENMDRLQAAFIYPKQPRGLTPALCSKKEMYYLAKQFGVPTPEVVFPKSRQEVAEFAKTAKFPIMLKGIDGAKLVWRTGKTMAIVQNARELLDLYTRMEDPETPNLILQEYIPGDDGTVWMFNGYFDENSDCLIGLTGRKIRQTPIHTGMTSLGIYAANPIVEETTKYFMKALGYKGILDIGYRYDARDGLYKVLDINPRIGAAFRLFVDETGMDVLRAMYLDLTCQPVHAAKPRDGRKWIVEFNDFSSCLKYRQEGHLTLREWITSFKGVNEAAYFAWDDLLPFWKEFANILAGKVGKLRQAWATKVAKRMRFSGATSDPDVSTFEQRGPGCNSQVGSTFHI